jgi:hypothetical protein
VRLIVLPEKFSVVRLIFVHEISSEQFSEVRLIAGSWMFSEVRLIAEPWMFSEVRLIV